MIALLYEDDEVGQLVEATGSLAATAAGKLSARLRTPVAARDTGRVSLICKCLLGLRRGPGVIAAQCTTLCGLAETSYHLLERRDRLPQCSQRIQPRAALLEAVLVGHRVLRLWWCDGLRCGNACQVGAASTELR